MTYSEEDMQRPVSGGFTRAELAELPDDIMREVVLGRVTKSEYDKRYGIAAPPADSQDPYAVTAWGSDEYDFQVPSGQKCRMRNLNEEMLLEAGILEQVTRLPGLVQQGPIRQAQGKPPVSQGADVLAMLKDPDKLKDMMGVMNKLVSVVVVRPGVRTEVTEEDPLKPGQVMVTAINLGDRIAIMERAMGGVSKLDAFRAGSEGTE